MKRKIKILMTIIAICLMGCIQVLAEEIDANVLLQLTQDVKLYESPDENSEVVGELSAGTPVISGEKNADGWIKVSYQELTGYTKFETVQVVYDTTLKQNETADSTAIDNSQAADTTALDQEFEQIANQNALIINELEYDKSQRRQKTIWGIVIAVLVVAIFAAGIISAVKKNKKEKGQEEETGHTDTNDEKGNVYETDHSDTVL